MKVIGIDLGGSKIRGGLVSSKGEVLKIEEIPTYSEECLTVIKELEKKYKRNTEDLPAIKSKKLFQVSFGRLCKVINRLMPSERIGIASPGPLDPFRGLIKTPPNMWGWSDVPLKKMLEEKFNLPTQVDNDANVATLGSKFYGAGKDKKSIILLILGTGFGCGIFVNGKLLRGSSGVGGEIWRTPYKDGLYDDYGSGRGIVAAFREKLEKHKIREGAAKKWRRKSLHNAKEIAAEASKGDKICVEALKEYGKNLGKMLAPVVNAINPDGLTYFGGVAKATEFFHDSFEKTLRKYICREANEVLEILPEKLDEVVIVGAACLALDRN